MVSIRFEVRGASRRHLLERGFDGRYSFNPLRGSRCFQTSSMMALTCLAPLCFNPLRGSRCFQTLPHDTLSRQALLRRFYTPPLFTPSNKRTEPVLNGVKPLVKWHTHLRLFLAVLQPPLSEGVSKTPGCGQPGLPASFNPTPAPPPGPSCQASADPAGFFTSPCSAAPGPVGGPAPGFGLPPSRPRTVSRSTASPCSRR